MGGGRAPCCDKTKVKRGAWTPAEDMRLTTFIQNHGHTNWRALPKLAGLLRCGKSCRLRWINYLRPDVKRGNFTREEEQIIINLHNSIGNKWSKIASYLPGRTDNEIKNVWNTYLKKKLKNDNKTKANDSKPNSSSSTYQFCTSSLIASSDDLNSKNPLLGGDVERSDSNIVSKDFTSDLSRTSSYAADSPTSSDIMHDFSKTEVICIDDDEKIVIPLESDIDFWELFDSLDENEEPETHVSHQEDGIETEWFKVLENELELDYDMKSLTNDQNDVPTTLEIDLEPEIGVGLDYFPIWPCSSPRLEGYINLGQPKTC